MKTFPLSHFDGQHWYYSTIDGELLKELKCEYTGIFIGKYSVFKILINNILKYGIINYKGEIVVKPIFDSIYYSDYIKGVFEARLEINPVYDTNFIIDLKTDKLKIIEAKSIDSVFNNGYFVYEWKKSVQVYNSNCDLILTEKHNFQTVLGSDNVPMCNIEYYNFYYHSGLIRDEKIYLVYKGIEYNIEYHNEDTEDDGKIYLCTIYDLKGKLIEKTRDYKVIEKVLKDLNELQTLSKNVFKETLVRIIDAGFSVGVLKDSFYNWDYQMGNYIFKKELNYYSNINEDAIVFFDRDSILKN